MLDILYRVLKYYNFISSEKLPTMLAKLSWSHYDEILKFDDINKILYYINISEQQNLSIRQLRGKIRLGEYERLPEDTRNKLITTNKSKVVDFVKNPILIQNSHNYEIISEKVLQKLILEDIESFMKELGNSFCFIGSEYKIRLDNTFNYYEIYR